jgi:hypothetical protein
MEEDATRQALLLRCSVIADRSSKLRDKSLQLGTRSKGLIETSQRLLEDISLLQLSLNQELPRVALRPASHQNS